MAKGKITFGAAEASLLGSVVFGFLCIFVYYGIIRRKYHNEEGYIFGGRSFSVVPIAISLTSSHITSITLLGIPVDIYKHGTQYCASALAVICVSLISAYVFLPVFHKLQLNSIFEYLEIRFSQKVRVIASVLFLAQKIVLLPVSSYVPLMAFDRSIPSWACRSASVACCLCAAACACGGLRAVCAACALGVLAGAGAAVVPGAAALVAIDPKVVWDTAMAGGRIVFFDPDPNFLRRTSFAAVMIGLTTMKLYHLGTSQSSMQRLSGLPSVGLARRAILYHCLGVILAQGGSCVTGVALYAWFAGCDPMMSRQISRFDELLPLFLSELGDKFPGVPGIFAVGVCCAVVSSMAVTINAMSVVTYEDVVRPLLPQSLTTTRSHRVMQAIALTTGLVCAAVVFGVHDLTRLMHISSGFTAVNVGVLLGLFTLGIVFHRANTKGAMCGVLGGLILCACAIIGTLAVIGSDGRPSDYKAMTTNKCANGTIFMSEKRPPFVLGRHTKSYFLFRFSFMYCAVIGALTVILIALPISYITRSEKDAELNPDLFCPPTRFFIKQRTRRSSESSIRARDKRRQEKERIESLEAETNTAYLSLDQALKQLKEISEI